MSRALRRRSPRQVDVRLPGPQARGRAVGFPAVVSSGSFERTVAALPHGRASGPWVLVRCAVLAATLAAVAGCFLAPDWTLAWLWNVVIPLVPASLLVSPLLWRNLCPLATLNMPMGRRGGRRQDSDLGARLTTLGIVLLFVLVPGRRVVFNHDGAALGWTVGVVAVAALAAGFLFDHRGGFCNGFCPVLPVERLYGQRPLVAMAQTRCLPCTGCTMRGCIDLRGPNAISDVLTSRHESGRFHLLRRPFGAFAAAFPGFVLGYFLTEDGGLSSAGSVYATVLGASLGSLLLVAMLLVLAPLAAASLMPWLAASACALYYFFATPAMAHTLGLPPLAGDALRMLFIALVAFWLWRSVRHSGRDWHSPASIVESAAPGRP